MSSFLLSSPPSSSKIRRRVENNVPLIAPKHICQLPHETETWAPYIQSGIFVNLRRKFRKWTLPDPNLPHCRKYLKSSAIIRNEQEMQMKCHYYMVHPFSLSRAYWEFFQIIVHIMVFMIGPIEFGTLKRLFWEVKLIKVSLDVLFLLDVIATFCTGYYDHSRNRVVLSRRAVLKNYLHGSFFTDLLSIVNVDIILHLFHPENDNAWKYKYLNFFKLFKFPAFLRYLRLFRDWKGFSKYRFDIMKCTLTLFLLYLWYSSAYMVALVHTDDKWLVTTKALGREPLISAVTKIFHLLFVFGYSIRYDRTAWAYYMEIVTLTLGMILRAYILSRFLQIFLKNRSSRSKYTQIIDEVKEYVKYKNLSATLGKRIVDYYEFCFQKTYFNEKAIINTISNQLKQAILMHTCEKFLQTVGLFRDLPTTLLYRIVMSLKVEYYLPQDLIVQVGDVGDAMFFIFTGTVAVYTKEGKEVCHLYDGSTFGEICLVLKSERRRVANVVAIDHCECYMLKREAFLTAVEPYPNIFKRLQKIALDRLKSTEDLSKIE